MKLTAEDKIVLEIAQLKRVNAQLREQLVAQIRANKRQHTIVVRQAETIGLLISQDEENEENG
jgi:hypothetical protein